MKLKIKTTIGKNKNKMNIRKGRMRAYRLWKRCKFKTK